MKILKILVHALKMVIHSKLRSWLTIIGIVIGVASVVAIMSIGSGMKTQLESQMSNLGSDLLTITAGVARGSNFVMVGGGRNAGNIGGSVATDKEIILSNKDLQVLKGIPNIIAIDTNIRGNVEVSYLGKKGSVSLTGVDQREWSKITTSKLAQGRFLDSADQNVIVIGGRLASGYFSETLGINKAITIEGSSYRIVGILDDSSTNIYMPIQMSYQILNNKKNGVYDSIILKVRDESLLNETMEMINNRLMISRHVTDRNKDFTISSNQQMANTRNEMMSSMNIFLTALAAISLLVGAIGIANTMFTSVLERTKQIGIMKAIGAKNKDILLMFIFNAAFIGFVGGIIGVFFGIILSGMIPSLLSTGTMFLRGGTIVTTESIVLALSVSVGIGIISGLIPAYQASRLKPVDALRYE
jgi:putative ABC transport system permease protein